MHSLWQKIGLGCVLVASVAAGLSACDQNVKFTIFRAKLDAVRPGMAQYTQPAEAPGQCVVDADRVDVGMLPLYTRRDSLEGRTVKELLLPGDNLSGCVLELVEGVPDTAKVCNVGTDDVSFSLTDIHLLTTGEDRICCGVECVAGTGITVVEDCAATYGEGWSCNQNRSVCEHDFELSALSMEFDPVGQLGDSRLIAFGSFFRAMWTSASEPEQRAQSPANRGF